MERQGISGQGHLTRFDPLMSRVGGEQCFNFGVGGSVAAQSVEGTMDSTGNEVYINVLKLHAIYLVLHKFLPYLRGRHVLVRSNSKSAVYQEYR